MEIVIGLIMLIIILSSHKRSEKKSQLSNVEKINAAIKARR